MLGFSAEELNRLLDNESHLGLSDPDDVPEPPDEPITQPGDLLGSLTEEFSEALPQLSDAQARRPR